MGIEAGDIMEGEVDREVSSDRRLLSGSGNLSSKGSFQPFLTLLRQFMPLLTALGTLLIGGFFLIHTPVGHVPDVWAHVYRISGITHGDLLAHSVHSRSFLHNVSEGAVGGQVDRAWVNYGWSIYDGYDPTIAVRESVQPGSSRLVDLPFNNTATNSPVSYLPQILAFGVGGILHLPVSTIYWMAEVCMLLVYSLCMFLGVRVLSRWRIGVGLLLLLPPLLYRSSFAISADSFTQAVIFLFTCMVFRAFQEKVSHRYCFILGAVGLVVAMSKFIYMPIVLVMLPVPFLQKRFRGLEHVDRFDLTVITGFGVLSLVWVGVWTSINDWYVTTPMLVSFQTMQARRYNLLTRPRELDTVIKRVIWAIWNGQSNNTPYGGSHVLRLAWAGMAAVVIILVIATLVWTGSKLDLFFSWCFTVLGLIVLILTYLALWLQYSDPNLPGVQGMQLRYFFPLTLGCSLAIFTSLNTLIAWFDGSNKMGRHSSKPVNSPQLF